MIFTSLILMAMAIFKTINNPSRSALLLTYELRGCLSPAIVDSLDCHVYIDTLKLSHRIAGPLERLSVEMNRLADGEGVEPLQFCDGDNWPEFAENFNELAEKVKFEPKSSSCLKDAAAEQPHPPFPVDLVVGQASHRRIKHADQIGSQVWNALPN